MDTPPLGFWLIWQSWRGYAEGANRPAVPRGKKQPPPPPVDRTWFGTREDAERAKAALLASAADPDLAVCIVPVTPPRAKPQPLLDDLPVLHKRLTR